MGLLFLEHDNRFKILLPINKSISFIKWISYLGCSGGLPSDREDSFNGV